MANNDLEKYYKALDGFVFCYIITLVASVPVIIICLLVFLHVTKKNLYTLDANCTVYDI